MLHLRYMFLAVLLLIFAAAAPARATAQQLIDPAPRIAIISAFEPELALLLDEVEQASTYTRNGVSFTTGSLEGKPVVMFLSGVSMVNAAMNTQLALDHFHITHIVFSGIAGGVNPNLHIGDVTVVERWGQYLEVLMARETAPGVFGTREGDRLEFANFGMMHPRPVKVRSQEMPQVHRKFWFEVDPQMLAVARSMGDAQLSACDTQQRCLTRKPQVVIGGNGVSGPAFVDNAQLREYVYDTFQANVLDMESAACAMVAYSNNVPFIAFRSLSDLAGGGEGANEMHTFMSIAADNSAKVLLAFLRAWQ